MFRGFPFLRVGAAASEFQVGRQVGFQAPEASSDLGLSATLLLFNHEVMSDSVTPWTAALLALLSSPIYWSLLTFVSIELVMLSNHLFLCCLLLFLPSFFPSIRVFSSESALRIRWPYYWSFSFSISPSSEYSGLVSFNSGLISLWSKGLSRVQESG